MQLEGIPFTVVGVTAPDFTGTSPDRVDVWLPMASTTLLRPEDRWTRNVFLKRACCVQLAGRLAPGVTREEAAAEADRAQPPLSRRPIQWRADRRDPVRRRRKTNATSLFPPMFLAVVLVLSLACANVGNLLLARATARRREIAVRLALGASRGRIVRQLLTESLILAVAAGALGILIALWAPSRLMTLLAPTSWLALRPDTLVLTFSAGLTLLSCALFGLLPALHGARTGVSNALKSGPLPRLAGLSGAECPARRSSGDCRRPRDRRRPAHPRRHRHQLAGGRLLDARLDDALVPRLRLEASTRPGSGISRWRSRPAWSRSSPQDRPP